MKTASEPALTLSPFTASQASQSSSRVPRRRLRSVGVVVAGFLATAILSSAVDVVLHQAGVFPPWGRPMSNPLYLLASAYRTVFCIGGCYLTARLAADRPLFHALMLGVVGLVVSTLGTLVAATQGPAMGPLWYPIGLVVLALPCAWVGGKLGARARLAA